MQGSRTSLGAASKRRIALAVMIALPFNAVAAQDAFTGLRSIDDGELDRLRGGFENGQGLQFSFAIERAVTINGELVTSTRLVLNDLSSLLSGVMPSVETLNVARNAVQSGVGNTIAAATEAANAPASAAAASASAAAAAAASTSAAGVATASTPATTVAAAPSINAATPASPVSAAPAAAATPTVTAVPTTAATATSATTTPAATATPVAATTPATTTTPTPAATPTPVAAATPATIATPATTPTATSTPAATTTQAATATAAANAASATIPLVVQVNGVGQTIVLPNASAIVAAVQNSVNNQIIQTRTTIDAMLNSLTALRTTALADAVRQQALDATRR